jgi:hypothetical protein
MKAKKRLSGTWQPFFHLVWKLDGLQSNCYYLLKCYLIYDRFHLIYTDSLMHIAASEVVSNNISATPIPAIMSIILFIKQ